MIIAPIPVNEAERLQVLRQLLILDTAPEQRFDRITSFASFEFDVPICLISLIDADRQWFKSVCGLDVCSTARDISFCGHTILQDDIMVVEDASMDQRFHDNPLVTAAPHIRFYAGAPLVMPGGERIGSLCLIDRKPGQIDATALAIFTTLRDLAVQELLAGNRPALQQEAR